MPTVSQFAARPSRPPTAGTPDPATWRAERAALHWRLVEAVAERCAAAGHRRIAMFGLGRYTRRFVRQPWAWHDVRVVAVLDDEPPATSIGGLPLLRPEQLGEAIDAVVITSDGAGERIRERARRLFESRGIPVLRIPGAFIPDREPPERTIRRLVERWGLAPDDARWLVENREERHDATLPVLPPARTEMHLRRYEFAAGLAPGRAVLDAACGTGYGSAVLADAGARSVVGLDVDGRAVDYARRRHGPGRRVEFRRADAAATGLPDASVDLAVSFETVEHVPDAPGLLAEFCRVLAPDGTLVLSTPNDFGVTPHHAHSFTRDSIGALLEGWFGSLEWLGQVPGDEPDAEPLPPGIFRLDGRAPRPEVFVVVAREPRRPA